MLFIDCLEHLYNANEANVDVKCLKYITKKFYFLEITVFE